MIEHIYGFVEELRSGNLEVYNEFSLQHELGIFIRSKQPEMKVQFERNVKYFFGTDEGFPKKEIDIAVWSEDEHGGRDLSAAIELKFPRNGRYPETMFNFITDIAFCEKLKECEKLKKYGFRSAYALIFADDKLFYEDGRSDKKIYGYFRNNQELSGKVQKPTGKKDKTVCLSGEYWIDWQPITDKLKFALVPVVCCDEEKCPSRTGRH